MFDINTIITQALNTAVQEAIKPLVERIAALENNPAIGVDTTLERRIAALENHPRNLVATLGDDFKADFISYLDNQEWFWEKLARKAGEAAQEVANQAVSDHCDEFNHEDYDAAVGTLDNNDPSEFVKNEDLSDAINDALSGAKIRISV